MVANNKSKFKGIFYIILASVGFSLMTLFLKLAGDIPSFEKSFFRNFVAIFFAATIILKNHIPLSIEDNSNLKYLIARSVFGTIGIFSNFYATDHLVLSDANMLNKLSPFFAVIFSFFLLKERIAKHQVFCLLLAFCGALCIIKPGLASLSSFPALVGAIGGMGAGMAYTCVRMATTHGVKGPIVVLFFSVFSCLASIPPMAADFVMPSTGQLAFLFLTGLSATLGQFAITAAYSYAPAKEISVYDYSQIVFAALWGFLFLGEIPDPLSIVGYFIIFAASFIMFEIKKMKG